MQFHVSIIYYVMNKNAIFKKKASRYYVNKTLKVIFKK